MLVGSDWCQTSTLGLEIWEKKRKIKKEVRIGPFYPSYPEFPLRHTSLCSCPNCRGLENIQIPNNGDCSLTLSIANSPICFFFFFYLTSFFPSSSSSFFVTATTTRKYHSEKTHTHTHTHEI